MIVTIQTIQINNYRFSIFPEDRIKTLISELNIHFTTIQNSKKHELGIENINYELSKSFSILSEILRLAPWKINRDRYNGDYKLLIDLLDSVIALLQLKCGNSEIRTSFYNMGRDLLEKLYNYSFESLVYEGLRYQWLDKKNLIPPDTNSVRVPCYRDYSYGQSDNKIKFDPTDQELNNFYEQHKQELYEYMVNEINPNELQLQNPFSVQDNIDFYHYHQTLKQIETSLLVS